MSAPANAFEAPPKVELTKDQARGTSSVPLIRASRVRSSPRRRPRASVKLAFDVLRSASIARSVLTFPTPSPDALNKTNELLKLPENVQKMDMAKAQMAAQPDNIMMLMMLVLPVATQALLPILAEFGFPQDQGGLMMFMSAVGKHKDDAEISALGKQMRATFVPENLEPVVTAMLSGGGAM
jgi:hypothetical protein